MKITIALHKDRSETGILTAVSSDGKTTLHLPCLGKADNAAAKANGNPTRDTKQPFGDIATGTYEGVLTGAVDQARVQLVRSFGVNRRIVLHPLTGDALAGKKNGRLGEMLHGGAPADNGGLRPTHGCVRTTDTGMGALAEACANDPEPIAVEVVEV